MLQFYVNTVTVVKNSAIYMIGTLFGPRFYVPLKKNNFLYLLLIKRSLALTKTSEDLQSAFLAIVSLFSLYFVHSGRVLLSHQSHLMIFIK